MKPWNSKERPGVIFYGKGDAKSALKRFNKAKRLALIKRRHRALLKQQAADQAPLEDESTVGDIIEMIAD